MATRLPALQPDNSMLLEAARLIAQQFQAQQARKDAADQAAKAAAGAEQYNSDLMAQIQRVMRKYSGGTPTVASTIEGSPQARVGSRATARATAQGTSPVQTPVDPLTQITTIDLQGQPVTYTDAELLRRGDELGFFDREQNRVVSWDSQDKKNRSELLNLEVESGLVTKEARETQDNLSLNSLANILTNGKYTTMTAKEKGQIRASLIAKDPKSKDPNLRISKLDKYKHFYDPQAQSSRRAFFYSSLVPKEQQDLLETKEGQVQYKDLAGRVETAMYLYDNLFKEYAQRGQYEEATRLPNAIAQAMKMYTMEGALPIQLSTYEMAKDGTPKLTLTPNGAAVITAVKSLMSGSFEKGPVPLEDPVRAAWEKQIPDLENRGLRINDEDSTNEMYAKFGGVYQALVNYYIRRSGEDSKIVLPQPEVMSSLAGIMVGITPARSRDLLVSMPTALKTDPGIGSRMLAYKSAATTQFSSVDIGDNAITSYNLPSAQPPKVSKVPSMHYPEYFSDTPIEGIPNNQEILTREIIGKLINDYKLDNGAYIPPTTLLNDIRAYGILQDSDALKRIISEYGRRYNLGALPTIEGGEYKTIKAVGAGMIQNLID